VDGIAELRAPELVANWWRAAVAIHAVVPTRHSLEERFMSLLATPADGGHVSVTGAGPRLRP
jgi:hypothetical protein